MKIKRAYPASQVSFIINSLKIKTIHKKHSLVTINYKNISIEAGNNI
jgi:hypothetical protein